MSLDNSQDAFFELVRAGLWDKEARLSQFGDIDYASILQLAEEQAVVGLVTAGLEHVVDVKVPQEWVLQFVGETIQIEQQNRAMNSFIAKLVDKMRQAGIYTLLVKGQGVAQCYERPLWRSSGDVDFYLSDSNYKAAKLFLESFATEVSKEDKRRNHLGMTINTWTVELHGTMYAEFSKRMNRGLDAVHRNIFYGGEVRSWDNNGVTVFLPSANNDVIIVFTHFLQHFYVGGIGLRQVSDWCRLLWKYREELDHREMEYRIRQMGLMTEWKTFGALAEKFLGMPVEAIPFYDKSRYYVRKANRTIEWILDTGNMGQNSDESYRSRYPLLAQKFITLWRRIGSFNRRVSIFPVNSIKFFVSYVISRVKVSFSR